MTAIYARQSVDRPDSISVDSQIECCRYEARGEAAIIYADRGYSGKNTDRPAFIEMMEAVTAGSISRVIVYKLDRISRSILDFSAMMERFEKIGVEFVSATERFDTSSPMGRAMLSICIVFAQLERETIQKRVADAYHSRSKKSLYMGGRIPYGYRLEPVIINEIHTAMYAAIPDETRQLVRIYNLYADSKISFGELEKLLMSEGVAKGEKPWQRTRLAETLRNPIYVRADIKIYDYFSGHGVAVCSSQRDFIGVNGCYLYHDPAEASDYLVLAPHEGIVSSEVWLKCRQKCDRSRTKG